MKMTFDAIAKKLLGAKYQKLPRAVLVFVLLLVVWNNLDVQVAASLPFMLLTVTAFTTTTTLQTLNSEDHAEYLKGFLVLPLNVRTLHLSNLCAVALYVIVTKTAVVLSLLIGFCGLTSRQICLALLASVFASTLGVVVFLLRRKTIRLAGVLFLLGHALCFAAVLPAAYLAALLAGMLFLLPALVHMDPHAYLKEGGGRRFKSIRHRNRSGPWAVFLYIARYIRHHKNYMVNTLALMAMGVLFSLVFGQMGAGLFLPLGFGILSMNTPMAILLSSDKLLRRNMDMLPGQFIAFALPYGGFVMAVNLTIYTVYLLSWSIINGPFPLLYVPAGVIFAAQAALLTIYMEWRHPLTNWTVETDLWHHPRKYAVPALLMLQSVAVGAWWWGIFIAAGLLLLELGYIVVRN